MIIPVVSWFSLIGPHKSALLLFDQFSFVFTLAAMLVSFYFSSFSFTYVFGKDSWFSFGSQKPVLKRFSLFVKDDRRFCKICFQRGLIVDQTPLFHQHLFKIFNCQVLRCDERQ